MVEPFVLGDTTTVIVNDVSNFIQSLVDDGQDYAGLMIRHLLVDFYALGFFDDCNCLFFLPPDGNTFPDFRSIAAAVMSESSNVSQRPRLDIEFTSN